MNLTLSPNALSQILYLSNVKLIKKLVGLASLPRTSHLHPHHMECQESKKKKKRIVKNIYGKKKEEMSM